MVIDEIGVLTKPSNQQAQKPKTAFDIHLERISKSVQMPEFEIDIISRSTMSCEMQERLIARIMKNEYSSETPFPWFEIK